MKIPTYIHFIRKPISTKWDHRQFSTLQNLQPSNRANHLNSPQEPTFPHASAHWQQFLTFEWCRFVRETM